MTGERADIPGYRIERELGRGGMATVYLAVQESLGREVALKLLSPQLSADPAASERFLREGRIAAKLVDRHIVGIYDVGIYQGQPYLAMEHMPGGAVATDAPHAPAEALEITRQIALALDHAHTDGVVHRDLKPDNILKRKDGSYALADFGIARTLQASAAGTTTLTQAGVTVGTPYYMSPEQLQAQPLDGRADLYSLGVVLYQLLTGQLPYRGTDDVPVGTQHIHAPLPKLPDNLRRFQPLVDALMAKSPNSRPASGAEVAKKVEALQAALTPAPTQLVSVQRAPARLSWIALTLVIVLAVAAWYVVAHRATAPEAGAVGGARGSDAAANAPAAKSIAVLPFANAGGNPDQQFFSDGLSENLITALSKFEGLTVIGRNSSFQFRDAKDDAKAIGARLGVTTLLEGSVQHAGDTVRVNAELIDAATSHMLWSERYDRPYKDLFALQDEITQAVANALKAKLLTFAATATAQSDRPPSGSLDAYNAYLQGKFYFSRLTEADAQKAIDQYQRATRIDPRYAAAFAELSRSLTGYADRFLGGEAAEKIHAQARKAAGTALELAPDLAAAHVARGDLLSGHDFDWQGAQAEYRRAAQLAPDDGAAKYSLGILLSGLGRLDEAIDLAQQVLATDPLNIRALLFLSIYQSALGRLDEAEAAVRHAIELQPDASPHYEQLAMIFILRGDASAALAAAQKEPVGVWHDVAMALATQIGPDHAAADAALKQLIDKDGEGAPFQIAEVYSLRHDADKTFEWLDRALEGHDPGITYTLNDPFLLRYKEDPRLGAFLKKAGLPATTQGLSIDAIQATAQGKH